MDPETRLRGIALVLLTLIIGVIGLMVIIGLFIAWSKANRRQATDGSPTLEEAAPPRDIWAAAGQRVSPEDAVDEDPQPEEDDEDEEDDDDPADWWKKPQD